MPAPGQHLDPPSGLLDQPLDEFGSFRRTVLLPAGEYPRDAEIDQFLQRAKRIGCDIEGAMKHRLA